MKSGYRILWSEHALDELKATVEYLELNFTERELTSLAGKIESILRLISTNPDIFPEYDADSGIRKVVVARFNTMYYRVTDRSVEILSFFSNRQDPEKKNL
jgi:plasmid stabilization system protein ParE